MTRQRIVKVMFFLAGGAVAGLPPGCLLPLAPLGVRVAGNGIIDLLLGLVR